MAQFQPAYTGFVEPWEGGYGFVTGDKGLETYAGISRKYNPSWSGWPVIDAEKKRLGVTQLKLNSKLSTLTAKVIEFYLNMWNQYKFGDIKNQDIANISFDSIVNHGPGGLQKILARAFEGDPSNPLPLSKYFATANTVSNPSELHKAIKNSRGAYYNSIILNDPTQEKFRKGWFARLASHPDLIAGLSIGLPLLFIIVLIAYILLSV